MQEPRVARWWTMAVIRLLNSWLFHSMQMVVEEPHRAAGAPTASALSADRERPRPIALMCHIYLDAQMYSLFVFGFFSDCFRCQWLFHSRLYRRDESHKRFYNVLYDCCNRYANSDRRGWNKCYIFSFQFLVHIGNVTIFLGTFYYLFLQTNQRFEILVLQYSNRIYTLVINLDCSIYVLRLCKFLYITTISLYKCVYSITY